MGFDSSRSTPAGYWHFAAQYFHAAKAVGSTKRNLRIPTLQLYGQSIELVLKAFLLQRGITHDEVKAMGHRLAEILQAANSRDLATQVPLTENDVTLINLLSENYELHRFRYIVTGATSIPRPEYVSHICERLLVSLEPYCSGSAWGLDYDGGEPLR